MRRVSRVARGRRVTRALLTRMPLPKLDHDGDKDARGRVLVVGGCMQTPGAVLLAGLAALRSGAGKLQVATVASVAIALGLALPEALVISLPATRRGELSGTRAAAALRDATGKIDALIIGPGMSDERSAHALLASLLPRLSSDATVTIDAAAILALHADETLLTAHKVRAILTPHTGEMASLLGVNKQVVDENPSRAALNAAERFGASVVLKGPVSWIATPAGALYRYEGGSVGLATSGSGDTLAGIIGGLAARGAASETAAVWGVWAHGSAGRLLSKRIGAVGFLARELLAELPALVGRG